MFPQKTPPSVINVPSTHIGCGSIIVDFVDYKLGKPSKEKTGNILVFYQYLGFFLKKKHLLLKNDLYAQKHVNRE